jgi:hypothetical protein
MRSSKKMTIRNKSHFSKKYERHRQQQQKQQLEQQQAIAFIIIMGPL